CRLVLRPGTGRVLTSNADGFHSMVARGPLLEDCELSRSGDDLLNIHGFFSLVAARGDGPGSVDLLTQSRSVPPPGSTVRFYDFATLAPKGSGVVAESAGAEPGPEALAMVDARKLAVIRPLGLARLRFDKPVEAAPGDLATDDALVCRGTVIRNSSFHDTACRAVVLKSFDGRIEGNRIDNVATAVAIENDVHFMEGPFSSNIAIEKNAISRSGFTSLLSRQDWTYEIAAITVVSDGGDGGMNAAASNTGIRIVGNTIDQCSSAGILVGNVKGGEVSGNTVKGAGVREPFGLGKRMRLAEPSYGLVVASSEGIAVRDNRFADPGPWCKGPMRWYAPVKDVGPQAP
ncbi:MAG TPA: right-handed parallel beta-helix repeat-containing protein, partial [Candidatus Methylacidiphilales bacterium]